MIITELDFTVHCSQVHLQFPASKPILFKGFSATYLFVGTPWQMYSRVLKCAKQIHHGLLYALFNGLVKMR